MKIRELTHFLENISPLHYQENYDNAGLLVGNENEDIKNVLLCLDSTEEVVEEAIVKRCNLIIAHHPIIFSGLKKLNGKNYIERAVIKAIQHNIAIYAAHTNLDNIQNGVNAKICEKLELTNCRILAPKNALLRKLVSFCPTAQAEKVRQAIFQAGAGVIGNYDECSFNVLGTGTFRASNKAKPYIGKIGEQHQENEERIETVFPVHLQEKILAALCKAHPYEEVAYDIYPLENQYQQVGSGMIGELKNEMDEMVFLKHLKIAMNTASVRYTKLLHKPIKRVAVCGGAGSFLLKDAIREGAQLFVTADFKYHQFFDAENKIVIADIGHYESEQFTKELFFELLNKRFSTFAIHLSRVNTNPINYF